MSSIPGMRWTVGQPTTLWAAQRRRRQRGRALGADFQSGAVRQFNNDRRRLRHRCFGRRMNGQHRWREPRGRLAGYRLLSPFIDQAGRHFGLARDVRHHSARCERRRQNPLPLILAPTPPALTPGQQRYLAHAALLYVLIRTSLRAQTHNPACGPEGGPHRRITRLVQAVYVQIHGRVRHIHLAIICETGSRNGAEAGYGAVVRQRPTGDRRAGLQTIINQRRS
jgi:hypothetical protein